MPHLSKSTNFVKLCAKQCQKVRGCFSSLTVLTMAFQLCRSAQKRWIKLRHPERLGEVIRGIKFVDGIIEKRIAAKVF